jgi:methionyl-tRNA formyltransferase
VARVRTVFFGSGTFALPALARLADGVADGVSPGAALVDLSAVVTAPPRPAGRRGELQPTPVALAAEARGIAILTPVSLRREEALTELRALGVDLVVLADYGRLIPAALLDLPRHGALNLHPSLLPRHRGAAPVPATILAGDAATGVTLMRMDEGLDSGPILAQREVPLDGTEVAPDLEARLAVVAADLLVEMLPAWLAGTLEARPQPADGATLTRPLRRSDGRLDPERPAVELERQVRAYQPWPGSFLEAEGERLIIWRAAPVERPDENGVSVPGAGDLGALAPLGDTLALRTSQGLLRLDEVQPAGRRRMSGAEYRRGRRQA